MNTTFCMLQTIPRGKNLAFSRLTLHFYRRRDIRSGSFPDVYKHIYVGTMNREVISFHV